MTKKLEQKLQAMTGKLPQAVTGTRSITVLEGDTLRTVSGGGVTWVTSGGGGGGGGSSGGGGGSRVG